jgi:hypothetical protein
VSLSKIVNGVEVEMSADEEAAFVASRDLEQSIPQEVSMRQARLVLFNAGMLSQVDAAIAAMSEPDKTIADIQWNHASTVVRDNAVVASLAAAIGLTSDQLDALFIAAEAL